MKNKIDWELSIGLYPGILFGFRSYNDIGYDEEFGFDFLQNIHVVYIPFIDISLTIYKY